MLSLRRDYPLEEGLGGKSHGLGKFVKYALANVSLLFLRGGGDNGTEGSVDNGFYICVM